MPKEETLMTQEQQSEFLRQEMARIREATGIPALPWPKPELVSHRNKIKDDKPGFVRGSQMPMNPRLESFMRDPSHPGFANLRKSGIVTQAGGEPRDSSFLKAVAEGALENTEDGLLIFLAYQSQREEVLRDLAPLQVLDFLDRNPSLWLDTRIPDADGGFGRH